jgi:hypothetical protein
MTVASRAPVRFDRRWASPRQWTPRAPIAAREVSLSLRGHLCHREDIRGQNGLVSSRNCPHQRRHLSPPSGCMQLPPRCPTTALLAAIPSHLGCICLCGCGEGNPTRSIIRAIVDSVRDISGIQRLDLNSKIPRRKVGGKIYSWTLSDLLGAAPPHPRRNWEIEYTGCPCRNTELPQLARMASVEKQPLRLKRRREVPACGWNHRRSPAASSPNQDGVSNTRSRRRLFPWSGDIDKRSLNDT